MIKVAEERVMRDKAKEEMIIDKRDRETTKMGNQEKNKMENRNITIDLIETDKEVIENKEKIETIEMETKEEIVITSIKVEEEEVVEDIIEIEIAQEEGKVVVEEDKEAIDKKKEKMGKEVVEEEAVEELDLDKVLDNKQSMSLKALMINNPNEEANYH